MTFNSLPFLVFLGFTAAAYSFCPKPGRRYYVLAVSYLYYALWSLPHAALLLAATAAAYGTGLRIEAAGAEKKKEAAMGAGVLVLLASLAFFKYGRALGLGILAPIGISYYTFKLISYVVDVYWEKLPAQRDFVTFAAYAAFFPQILSGPIQRAVDFFPQAAEWEVDAESAARGLRLIAFGLFQKIAVADRLAPIVNQIYKQPGAYHGWPLLLGVYAFTLQLYADFSGVTDIAIGAGLLFGIRAPENFNAPFSAPNIQEFWRRWHITLTTWLTDYVFTPLRMSLRDYGSLGLVATVFLTMVLIGVWHGPRWNYLIFGALHGVYLVVSTFTLPARNRFFKGRAGWSALRKIAGPLITFQLVTFSFIFFRAESTGAALTVIRSLLVPAGTWAGLEAGKTTVELFLLAAALCVMAGFHRMEDRALWRWPVLGYVTLTFFLLLGISTPAPFLYFKF